MTEKSKPTISSKRSTFFRDLGRELREIARNLANSWRRLGVGLRNRLRRLRRGRVDYVLLPISGSLPERAAPRRSFIQRQLPFPEPPFSMETLNRRLRAIGDAPNVKGVVFVLQGLEAGLATLQNLRRAIERLRAAGKEVVVYTPYLDLPHYFVATAANRIVAPPSAEFTVLGLRAEVTYLRDALQRVGLKLDAVQISPYKSAYNPLSNADMTPEEREQLNWLLDEQFEMLLAGMAARQKEAHTPESLRRLLDQAPFSASQAAELGLIEDVGYEDELPFLLAEPGNQQTNQLPDSPPKANLQTWQKAAPLLWEKHRRRPRQFIGVISLEGGIVMGRSRTPPINLPIPFIGGQMAGEQTLVQLLRQAEEAESMAALIFHVDSGGGSALASDLIAREVARIAQKKPVLAYMGNVAASGGYYVSAPAQHIMSQRGSVTGSIGVINGRLSTSGLLQKLHLNQVHLDRGERIGLYRNNSPMTEQEKQIFWESIVTIYTRFKQVVGHGRSLPVDELDPICEGRVWTGRQALAHKLVDSHGDFIDAIQQAAEMAGLPADDAHAVSVRNFYPKDDSYLPAAPFAPANLDALSQTLLGDSWRKLIGQPLLLLPYHLRFY